MRKIAELAAQTAWEQNMIKLADFLDVHHIEDFLDTYLPDELEDLARQYIQEERMKSFALRHPVLTGIPTLGLWPLIAREKAIDRVARKIVRRNAKARKLVEQARQRRIQEAKALKDVIIAQQKAEAQKEIAATASSAAVSLAGTIANALSSRKSTG